MIGRKGLDENALDKKAFDEKALDENWAHKVGLFLVNHMHIPPPSPLRIGQKLFAYVSDDFKQKINLLNTL